MMAPEVLQFIGQLGLSGLMFYLLLDERKQRATDLAAVRAEKQEADRRYFDFLEKLILRNLKIANPEE